MTTASAPKKAAPPERQRIDWKAVANTLRASPGEWFLVAEDVSTGVRSRLQRVYQLEVRMTGVDPDTHRAAQLYARAMATTDAAANRAALDARARTKHMVTRLRAHDDQHPGELAEAYRLIRAEIMKGEES